MELAERKHESETRQFKVVFPNTLNDNDTLFGGVAMKWMDEVAYIAATRFTRLKMVTISADKIKFKHAIKPGTIVEIIGKVLNIGNFKLDIQVEIWVENMHTYGRLKAVYAVFTFAAINENGKLIPIRDKKFIPEFN